MTSDPIRLEEMQKTVKYIDDKILEIKNNMALLSQAKNGYISEIKKEVLHAKAGIELD
jgi:hypothetical protein